MIGFLLLCLLLGGYATCRGLRALHPSLTSMSIPTGVWTRRLPSPTRSVNPPDASGRSPFDSIHFNWPERTDR